MGSEESCSGSRQWLPEQVGLNPAAHLGTTEAGKQLPLLSWPRKPLTFIGGWELHTGSWLWDRNLLLSVCVAVLRQEGIAETS